MTAIEIIDASKRLYESKKRTGSSRHLDLMQGFESGAKWARDKFESQLAAKDADIARLKDKYREFDAECERIKRINEKYVALKTNHIDFCKQLLRDIDDHHSNCSEFRQDIKDVVERFKKQNVWLL